MAAAPRMVAALSRPAVRPVAVLCAFVALAGLIGAGRMAATVAPPIRQVGDTSIVVADLHVHTFPGDGALLPWDLAREAARRGLNAIAITAHNQMLAINATWPRETPFGVLLIPGEEITRPDVHIAAVGLTRPIGWRGTIPEVVAAVHAEGAVAIAAHPAEDERPFWTDDALRVVDGIEVAHPTLYGGRRNRADLQGAYAQALAVHPSIAAIGSSDMHTGEPLGFCRTFLFVHAVTTAGLLEAIQHGRTVACDAGGHATGPASLTAEVADTCRADARADRSDAAGPALATALAWIGLLGLAFFGWR